VEKTIDQNTPGNGPQSGSHTATLRDGTEVTIRPVVADDAPRLQALFNRLSPESIYYRFLSQPKELSREQAERLTNVDYDARMAYVATLSTDAQDPIIGVARYAEGLEPGVAEAGVVVEDRFQRQGLGTILLTELVQYARNQGIHTFVAWIHQSNAAILQFIRRSGLPTQSRLESGMWEIRVQLEEV
jgi:RimJ/RimL family protein N-acetyltransferase